MATKQQSVIKDHENFKKNEVDTVSFNMLMSWTVPFLHQQEQKQDVE